MRDVKIMIRNDVYKFVPSIVTTECDKCDLSKECRWQFNGCPCEDFYERHGHFELVSSE